MTINYQLFSAIKWEAFDHIVQRDRPVSPGGRAFIWQQINRLAHQCLIDDPTSDGLCRRIVSAYYEGPPWRED